MRNVFVIAIALLCAASMQAQKLPCTVQAINKALAEHEMKVTNTSQYLLMDINADGVKDIVMRTEDSPSAGYVVLLCKGGKLEVEKCGYDGYDMLGMAPGGYSFYQHDDHMGPSGRSWNTDFTRYAKGKAVMRGESSLTLIYENEEPVEDVYYAINGKEVTKEAYDKVVPGDITWFCDIKEGWRMVMNNQNADAPASDDGNVYKGDIGSYPITMCLDEDNSFNGFYYYDKRPETRFTLKCVSNESTPDGDNDVVLEETSPKGKHTGTFKGRIRMHGSSFGGKFTNFKGQDFNFQLYKK